MNTTADRRKKHYVDRRLQGRWIAALIALEVSVIVCACAYLYWQFNQILEASAYRIHGVSVEATTRQLLQKILHTMVVVTAINVLALFAAQYIWTQQTQRLLKTFTALLQRITELELRRPPPSPLQHQLLEQAGAWQRREHQRAASCREHIQQLAALAPHRPTASQIPALRQHLESILNKSE